MEKKHSAAGGGGRRLPVDEHPLFFFDRVDAFSVFGCLLGATLKSRPATLCWRGTKTQDVFTKSMHFWGLCEYLGLSQKHSICLALMW